jgi:hypothetical protein
MDPPEFDPPLITTSAPLPPMVRTSPLRPVPRLTVEVTLRIPLTVSALDVRRPVAGLIVNVLVV